MRWPSRDSIELLAEPTSSEAAYGAFVAWSFFTPFTASAYALLYLFGGSPGYALIAFLAALVSSAFVAGLIAFAWGIPLGFLIARTLAPTGSWQFHLVAQIAFGAITGFIVWCVGSRLLPRVDSDGFISPGDQPYIAGSIVLTALSVGLGWALSWRRTIRRVRLANAAADAAACAGDTGR